MVAAIMGAQARLGHRGGSHDDHKAITAESFDRQVADKIGEFFDDVSLPVMKKLIEAGLSYDEVKRLVKMPTTWGAKISGDQFQERASKALNG